MAAVTSITIALGLAEQMAGTHLPNTGVLQPGSAAPAAQAADIWFQNQSGIDFADLTVDASWSNSPAGLVDVTACGCSIALISYMVKNGAQVGVTLATIANAINTNPYVTLGSLYPDLWTQFTAAVAALPNGVQNNDPFGAFGVVFPVPPTIEQQIVTKVLADGGFTVSQAVYNQMVADVAALLS
jgi:hypothetical protein